MSDHDYDYGMTMIVTAVICMWLLWLYFVVNVAMQEDSVLAFIVGLLPGFALFCISVRAICGPYDGRGTFGD